MSASTSPSARDKAVLRMATEEGVTNQREIAQRLVAEGFDRITPERIGQILRVNSGRDRVVKFLQQHPDNEYLADEIAHQIGLDVNRVLYVVAALGKKGIVTYVNGKSPKSGHASLDRIRLTKRALNVLRADQEAKAKQQAHLAEVAAERDKPMPDRLMVENDWLAEHQQTEGKHFGLTGPGTSASLSCPLCRTAEADVEAVLDGDAPPSGAEGRSIEINGLPEIVFTREAEPEREKVEISDRLVAFARPEPLPMEPESEPEAQLEIAEIPRYPLINKLLDREADLTEAAKLLERHGLDDLALSAMAKLDDFTPFEREVIMFVRDHHG